MPASANSAATQRTRWRACALGLLIGLGAGLLIASAVFFGSSLYANVTGIHGWDALGLALMSLYGAALSIPLFVLAGGALGAFRLRHPRGWRFTYLWFPLALIPVVLLAGTVCVTLWATVGHKTWERLQEARHLQWAVANRSPDDIFGISLYSDPSQAPEGYAWQHFTADMPIVLQTSESIAPGWSAQRTLTVSWQRILPCTAADPTACHGNGDRLEAVVHLPRYAGSWNKAYVAVFLPHDRVGIVVIDRDGFTGTVQPPQEALVVQGVPKPGP